jgi:hypothetical protein
VDNNRRSLTHRQRRRDTLPLPDQGLPTVTGPEETVLARARVRDTGPCDCLAFP